MAKKFRIALFSVLSVLVTCFIFSNSLPGIDESSVQSSLVAEFLRPFLDPKHRLSDEMFHHIVRKMAHFIEFGALGVCLSCLSVQFVRSISKTWGTPFVLSVLIALTDESIQYFTGRGNSLKDVLLDSTGALCGVLFTALLCMLMTQYKKNRRGDSQCQD